MDIDKNRPKEPFKPEDTPTPPQAMHPGSPDGTENVLGKREKPDQQNDRKKKEEQPEKKKKLLGDETEIDDETTI